MNELRNELKNKQSDPDNISALLIKASGHIEDVMLTGNEQNQIQQIQAFVGGEYPGQHYFEVLPMSPECETLVCVHEEGRLRNMPMNMPATLWLNRTGRSEQWVCGDVLVVGPNFSNVHPKVRSEIPDFRSEDYSLFRPETIEYRKGT